MQKERQKEITYTQGTHPNSHKHSKVFAHWTWGTHPKSWERSLASGFVPGVRKPETNYG